MPATLSLVAREFGVRGPGGDAPLPSLFILSLPRSLSSLVHKACCAALGLHAPAWTSDGEIMNVERSVFLSDRALCAKYTQPRMPHLFGPAAEFLTEIVQPRGFGYKDVTQPFVASAWLRDREDIRVLKILPNLTHTAFAMMRRNWLYPVAAAPSGLGDIPTRLVTGLTLAAEAIAAVPGESVSFDDLLSGTAPLEETLRRLYPEVENPVCDFGEDFAEGRAQVLARRALPTYQDMETLVRNATAFETVPTPPMVEVRSAPSRQAGA